MDFTQIRYFLAVAECLNFTKAADKCSVSQPALSKSVRKLEEDLGAELFDRDSQHVELTEFGITMQVHFERIEDNLRKARNAADAITRPSGKLNIGIMCTIGPLRFGALLQEFRQKQPNIEVILHDISANLISPSLLSGAIDCVICASAIELDGRFEIMDLVEEEMVVAFSNNHPFHDQNEISLSQIARESYLDRLHCEFREEFLKFTKAQGLELNVALSSEREDWIFELIECGLGVSVVPISSAVHSKLEYRPISDMADLRRLKLVALNKDSKTKLVNAFQEAIKIVAW